MQMAVKIKYLSVGLKAKIMAGGGPVTERIAQKYGADGWALTGPVAVEKALDLLK